MPEKRKASQDLSTNISSVTSCAASLENTADGKSGARMQRKTSPDHPLTSHLLLVDQPQRNSITGTFDPEAYTVGWVTSLSLELAAAIAMLDEEHE